MLMTIINEVIWYLFGYIFVLLGYDYGLWGMVGTVESGIMT